MAKELKEMIEEILKDLIQDGKVEIQDSNGEKIDDLSVGFAEDQDEDQDIDDEDFDDEEEEDK
tara:strand:- start:67 stop:255 length:189 start_codon:yes stop_codon:yes gene_type:complete